MTEAEKKWKAECSRTVEDYIGGDLAAARVAMWHTQAARARDFIAELSARLREAEETIVEAVSREDCGCNKITRLANLEGYFNRKARQWPGS